MSFSIGLMSHNISFTTILIKIRLYYTINSLIKKEVLNPRPCVNVFYLNFVSTSQMPMIIPVKSTANKMRTNAGIVN